MPKGSARAVSARARRSAADPPLSASEEKQVSSGAHWLGVLRLRHATPRARSERVDSGDLEVFKSKPIADGTPRDEHGASLKSAHMIDYFNRKQQPSPRRPRDTARPVQDPLVFVKRGEASPPPPSGPTGGRDLVLSL